jgi:hypothetical protein
VGTFNATLHPRGPNGRFTRSFARHMSSPDGVKAKKVKAGFHAHTFHGPDDAHTYLGHLSGVKTPGKAGGGGGIRQYLDNGTLKTANEALRAGKTDNPAVHAIDATMKPLPDDLQLFRTVPASKFGKVDPKSLEGMLVSDAGYFPATIAPQKGGPGTVQLHVQAPAGTKAAVDPDSGQVVLGHGAEMAVDSVDVAPDGSTRMNLVALPSEGVSAPAASTGDPGPGNPPPAPGTGDLARRITSQGVAERHLISGGQMGTAERVVLDDGTEVFAKENEEWGGRSPRTATDAEQLAARVAEVLRAPVPQVHRTGENSLMTDWTPGRTADEAYNDPNPPVDPDTLVDTGPGRRLGLLDMLVANPDRHDGNWMVTDDGQLVGIDHGLAWFPVDLDDDSDPFLPTEIRGPFVRGFRTGDRTLMTPADVVEIRRRLESLRPEFEHLGHGAWLDHSLDTLGRIGADANGSRSIFDD